MQDVGNMLKMKFWFEGNQLQPDCNIHGGCKIGSSACHACPHCVRVNSKDQEVLCLGDGEEECAVIDTTIGVEPENLYRYYGTREECLVYIQEHLNEPNLGIIP